MMSSAPDRLAHCPSRAGLRVVRQGIDVKGCARFQVMVRHRRICEKTPTTRRARKAGRCVQKPDRSSVSRITVRATSSSPATDLVFRLEPDKTLVRAELMVQRREGADRNAPLVLDGDGLTFVSLSIDGVPAQSETLHRHSGPARDCRSSRRPAGQNPHRDRSRPLAQHRAHGPLPLERGLLHPVRSGGFPPHHLLPSTAGRPVRLLCAHRGPEGGGSAAPLQRKPGAAGISVTAGISPNGTIRIRSRAISLRSSPATSASCPTRSAPCRAAWSIWPSMSSTARKSAPTTRMDALKRSMRWDEEVFGLEYDLDVFNIVAVSDFNMGAMENKGLNVFNEKLRAGRSGDRDGHRLRPYRGGDRPQYFHNWTGNRITLPGLVPALPQGRADGFSAITSFPTTSGPRAVKRIAEGPDAEGHAVSGGPGPARPSRAARANTARSTTSTRRPSTRRDRKSSA